MRLLRDFIGINEIVSEFIRKLREKIVEHSKDDYNLIISAS